MAVEGAGLDVLDLLGFSVEGSARQTLVVTDLVHLPDDPGLGVEAVLEQVGVVLRKVAIVIGQRIHV